MNFFCVKPINQIIYNDHKAISVIRTKDAVYYSDDTEYMRRIYNYYTATGKKQIQNRIQLLAGSDTDYTDFYDTIKTIRGEYPLMILTNTKKIFLARLRRLRKMKASDGSSDQSEQSNQEKQQFASEGFLKSMNSKESSLQLQSIFESVRDRQSFDSQTHDIYDIQTERQNKQLITQMKVVVIDEETNLDHLIYDFGDTDAEKIIKQYDKLMETNYQRENKEPLKSLFGQKKVANSIVIDTQSNGIRNSNSKYLDLLAKKHHSHRFGNIPSRYGQHYNRRNQFSHDKELDQRNGTSDYIYERDYIQIKNRHKNNEQNQSRKQKIRDKAAQLLNRVKNSNYMNADTSSQFEN